MTEKQYIKREKLEKLLKELIIIIPCYGERDRDPLIIEIGNGLILSDKKGFIASGCISVARELILRGE